MSAVTVGCEAEQTDRAEESGERRKVAHTPPSGGISNSWGNSLFWIESKPTSVAGRPAAGQAGQEPLNFSL